jgi:maleate isomerase
MADKNRVGLIVPSSNINMEDEFRMVLPKEIKLHSDRMRMRRVTPSELKSMDKEALNAAVRLSDADVGAIVYGCTIAITSRKQGYHEIVRKRLEHATHTKVIISAAAVLDAMRYMNMRKIAVATPYTKAVTEAEIDYFKKAGFEVVDYKYLGIADNLKVGNLPEEIAYKLAKKLDISEADGILVSCAELPSINILDRLEKESKKTVISTNTASLWKVLKTIGSKKKINGFGKILFYIEQ